MVSDFLEAFQNTDNIISAVNTLVTVLGIRVTVLAVGVTVFKDLMKR